MKSMVERLKEQKEISQTFSKKSFGMPVGDGFPELVREVISDKEIATELAVTTVLNMLAIRPAKAGDDIRDLAREEAVYKLPLSFLYYGIEIGRQLEREAMEVQRA